MIKKIAVSVLVVLFVFVATPSFAGAQSNEDLVAQVAELLEKVRELQNQLALIQGKAVDIKSEIRDAMMLTRELAIGMTGEDVEALQELLASDPNIYPEGLVTGYFGPLTLRAVQRFQVKANLPSVGNVGPETMWRINEILEDGVGPDGRIPSGLLTAPGIQKKFQEGFMERHRERDPMSHDDDDDDMCQLTDEQQEIVDDLEAFEVMIDTLDEQISDSEWDDAMDTLGDLEDDESVIVGHLNDEGLTDEADDLGDWMDLLRGAVEDEDEDSADELVDDIEDLLDDAEDAVEGDCDDDDDDDDDEDDDDDDSDDDDEDDN